MYLNYMQFIAWQLYSIKLFQNVVYKHSYFSEKVPMKGKKYTISGVLLQRALLGDLKPTW